MSRGQYQTNHRKNVIPAKAGISRILARSIIIIKTVRAERKAVEVPVLSEVEAGMV